MDVCDILYKFVAEIIIHNQMKRLPFFIATIVAMLPFVAEAQIVTTTPIVLQESSSGVLLTYHADSPLGNGQLANLPESTQLYAHIGVILSGSSEWSHVVAPWPAAGGTNADAANTSKNHLTRISDNTYTLNIGDIRNYFGITNPSQHVERIAVVFRNADGSLQGKTAGGGDIFVNIHPEGFAMSFTCDAANTVISSATEITFTLATTNAADLTISVDNTNIASATASTTLTKSYTFDKKGYYTVTATATHDGLTETSKITVAWPEASQPAPYPGGIPKQGTISNPDGTVTFCIAAPDKQSVILVGSWDDYAVRDNNVMASYDYENNRYFWLTVSGLDNDKYYPYYYLVDGTTAVADPYAHLILDCYSDKWLDPTVWPDMPKYPYDKFDNIMLAVYRGDLDNYDWSAKDFSIPDHSQLIVYEMLLRDFTGTVGEANANGTVREAIEKIPYLKSLGVNAVELMPIMEFNGNNSWGYNTNFYFAPDKSYGSPDDYREFIDVCHSNGIAVVLDIVFNQSDGLHPWYQMYPISSNPFYNAEAPHDYSVLNDWNQGGNTLVEQQWHDALRYWMTSYNVDGFRFDLVKGLGDNNSYGGGTDAYNSSRINRMKRLHETIKSVKPNGIHINEDLAGDREEKELGEDGMLQWANINTASGRFAAGWNADESGIPNSLNYGWPLSAFLSTSQGNRPWGSTVPYAESHDEQRIGFYAETNGKNNNIKSNPYNRLGVLAAEMLLTPGPKMIWQFGELGDSQNTKTSTGGNNTDPKTVVWNLLEEDGPSGLHDTYQTLCNLRLNNPELFTETATFETTNIDATLATARSMRLTCGNKELIVLINASTTTQAKTLSCATTVASPSTYRLLAATAGLTVSEPTTADMTLSVKLPGGSFAVFGSTDTQSSGIKEIEFNEDAAEEYYNLQGIKINKPEEGKLYIVRRGNITMKEIR